MRQIFNEVLNKDDCTPETCRRIRIKVIHEKKETCRMLVMSAQIVLCLPCTNCCSPHYCATGFTDPCQPADQGGFKRSHQTVDHLMVNRMLEQRCREWSIPMFISTIDFTKAFDRVKHQSLWNALKHFEIDPTYIDFLKIVTLTRRRQS